MVEDKTSDNSDRLDHHTEPGSDLEKEATTPGPLVDAFQDEKVAFGVIAVVVLVFVVMAFLIAPQGIQNKLENRAIEELRRIGRNQLAYSASHVRSSGSTRSFGSLDALVSDGYLDSGATLDNLIEGYYLRWEIREPRFKHAGLNWGDKFTIIAYPRPGYEKLSTFRITDSMVIRKYIPNDNTAIGDLENWDAVDQDRLK